MVTRPRSSGHQGALGVEVDGSWPTMCPLCTRTGSQPPSISCGGRGLLIVLAVGTPRQPRFGELRGTTPAGQLGDGEAEVEWYLDRDAASLLV